MNANTTANARKYSLRGKFYIVDSWGGLHRPTTRTEAAWYCDGIPRYISMIFVPVLCGNGGIPMAAISYGSPSHPSATVGRYTNTTTYTTTTYTTTTASRTGDGVCMWECVFFLDALNCAKIA
jgi:hypothetical protein